MKDCVNADIEACADGTVRYAVVYDNHVYENGFRRDWWSAISRVGSIMHELAEQLPEKT